MNFLVPRVFSFSVFIYFNAVYMYVFYYFVLLLLLEFSFELLSRHAYKMKRTEELGLNWIKLKYGSIQSWYFV